MDTSKTPRPTPPRRSGWFDAPLTASQGHLLLNRTTNFVLIAVLAFLDAVLMRPALLVALDEEDGVLSWFAPLGLALAAAAAMFYAGRLNAGARGRRRTASPGAMFLILVWLAAGALIALVRYRGASTVTNIADALKTQNASGAHWYADSHALAALMFLIIYLIIGVLAYLDASHDRNDAFTAKLITGSRVEDARNRLSRLEGTLTWLASERARVQVEGTDVVTRQLRQQYQASANLADHAADHARLTIAKIAADPATTGITSPQHPDTPHR